MNRNLKTTTFWKDKKVLITGHTGFVGTWLTMYLQHLEVDLYGIALDAEPGSLYKRIEKSLLIQSTLADFREKKSVYEAIQRIQPEVVIHLAAFGFVQECFQDPERAFSTNVTGTYHLLHAIEECSSVKCVIIASSDKVYQNNGKQRLFSERDPLGGLDPYSASKTCQDILSRSFYETYWKDLDIGMCVVRPSNILGGFDHHENRLIPSIYRAFQQGKKPVIRNPQAVRPWQDILDICDAYRFLTEKTYQKKGCEIINVGPETNGICTVEQITDIIAGFYDAPWISDSYSSSSVSEQPWLGLSVQKIISGGWSPKMGIYDILKKVYECYGCQQDDEVFRICMKQIKDYQEKGKRELFDRVGIRRLVVEDEMEE